MKRRSVIKLGLAAGGASVLAPAAALAQDRESELLKYLCPPDGFPPDLSRPSPKAEPFVADLFVPPVMNATPKLDPPPDPQSHQRYEDFLPKKFYEIREQEFQWQYHPHPPYSDANGNGVSWSWGFADATPDPRYPKRSLRPTTPGPTYHARYGEPVLVRRYNALPPVGQSRVTFALPSTTSHLHNGHTASESDGNPQDWIDSGEFWDHHYGNFPSGGDSREKLTTLWYHDHRLDFTAANVYAGLAGFYLLFDEQDSGNETDPNPSAWRLPSGAYDVPMLLHDVLFDQTGQVVFNPFNTDGILGDQVTINRTIRPRFRVERRKYRIRLLNGGPSRFYQLFMRHGQTGKGLPFTIVTGDGNFQPEPVLAESIYLSVAQRVDVVIDFSQFKVGDHIHIVNRLEQYNGRGPSGRLLDPGDSILRFEVIPATGPDPSRVPDYFRPLPPIDLSEVKFQRTWEFDYDGGLWTINGRVFDPNRIDAGIEQGSAEIWTFRNAGNDWAHPIHSHFTEFLILEINGKPYPYTAVQDANEEFKPAFSDRNAPHVKEPPIKVFMGGPRRDVATILPGDEMKVFMRWKDFLGKHVMHCHNVVHEDHSMMIRWDIVEPGKGFVGPRPAGNDSPPHLEERPASATQGPPETE